VPSWLIAILPVLSALLGVVAGNWASTRHDAVNRLWEHRVQTYLDLIDWTVKIIKTWVGEPEDSCDQRADLRSLHLPDELTARVWVFASQTVISIIERCELQLDDLEKQEESESRVMSYVELENDLLVLRRAIRLELSRLSRGRLRIPLAFRVRIWRRVNR
jgi:hypothetical protein